MIVTIKVTVCGWARVVFSVRRCSVHSSGQTKVTLCLLHSLNGGDCYYHHALIVHSDAIACVWQHSNRCYPGWLARTVTSFGNVRFHSLPNWPMVANFSRKNGGKFLYEAKVSPSDLLDRASSLSCSDEENYRPNGLQISAGRDHVAHESGSP